jgi:UDP-N-acetylmuramyl pentapeptide phosphotransferase/UDP-N-acetylglucosamine-1-phosphate transferase
MSWTPGLVLWSLLFAAIGAAGTWLARGYALRRHLLDQPGDRRSHAVATPRGGGIAIALAFLVAIVAMAARRPDEIVLLVCAAIGLVLVSGIGWIDDHRPLSPWSRLAVHVLAAGWLMAGVYLSGRGGGAALGAFVAALVLVNVWNFMDGIDGLAASQAVLAGAGLAFLAGTDALAVHLGLALIASIFGFLPFNFPRARIFLGDVGSGALGYALALLLAMSMHRLSTEGGSTGAWLLVLLPVSAFVLDAGLTLSARVVRGEKWWTPHVQHVYQRWARRLGGHPPVTAAYAVWTLVACSGAAWLAGGERSEIAMAVSVWLASGIGLWCALRVRSADRAAN